MQEATALLELQRIDIELLQAEKRLEELPEKRAILEVRAKLREIETMKAKAELLVRKLEAEVKVRQDEIAMIATKLDGEQSKIMETTDHRQITALTREMEGLKRRVDKLEMEELQYMERVEKASAQIATIGEAITTLSTKEKDFIKRFKKAGGAVQTEIASLQKQRATAAKDVSEPLNKRYESIRASRGGVGVGKLDGDTCSACRMSLPAESVQNLRIGPDIGLCPQCRRLIVVRDEAVGQ